MRDRVLETLRLAAPELKSGVSAIPPIPHIVVPFTLTVSLKSGWGFRHRTETEGVKVPFATITTIPNIQTALFIQPTAIGTAYEDCTFLEANMTAKRKEMGGFKFMRYQPHIRCNIAYTP